MLNNDWFLKVIDEAGYRANVGIILLHPKQQKVLWARRIRQKSWQFPQGGLNEGDSALSALYRELWEEVGLRPTDVEIIAATKSWFKYRLPEVLLRKMESTYIGQKQKWFLLRLRGHDDKINLAATTSPEFDDWRWVEYWYPLNQVIAFKRHVYRKALEMFYPLLKKESRYKRHLTFHAKRGKITSPEKPN
jgi:putative (di)nucleoside polyphosphate hydrolase